MRRIFQRRQAEPADTAYQHGCNITIDIRWLSLPTKVEIEENPGTLLDAENLYGVMLEFLVRAERKGVPLDHSKRNKIGRTDDGKQMILILSPDPYPTAYQKKICEAYKEATKRSLRFGANSNFAEEAGEEIGGSIFEAAVSWFIKFLRNLAG